MHTKCQKRAFWRCTVSAASAQTYFGGFETFTVQFLSESRNKMEDSYCIPMLFCDILFQTTATWMLAQF
jgi:hypothetical protein